MYWVEVKVNPEMSFCAWGWMVRVCMTVNSHTWWSRFIFVSFCVNVCLRCVFCHVCESPAVSLTQRAFTANPQRAVFTCQQGSAATVAGFRDTPPPITHIHTVHVRRKSVGVRCASVHLHGIIGIHNASWPSGLYALIQMVGNSASAVCPSASQRTHRDTQPLPPHSSTDRTLSPTHMVSFIRVMAVKRV